MDKSASESNLLLADDKNSTLTDFVAQRPKRKRDECTKADLQDFKIEIKEMLKTYMFKQKQEQEEITSSLKEIRLSNQSIENSIALLMSQNEEYKKKIESLEIQTKKDQEYISLLEEKLEDSQRILRKTNIEIKNVPKKKQETTEELINMFINLSKNINCPLEKTDIKDIYRAKGKKESNNPPIIVEINSSILKRETLKLCKQFNIKNKEKLRAKHLGFTTNEDHPIFVTEHLTPKNARLHFLARDIVKSKSYKFCWTYFGKVYIQKDENSPRILINNEAQVHHLIQSI